MRRTNDYYSMEITRSLAMSEELSGAMICTKGTDIGAIVPLRSDKKLVVGRDPAVCNYVISDSRISRKHFEITYIGALNQYLVVDWSSNGTFLNSGQRMQKNREYYLPPKTELLLGTNDNVYKLR